MLALIIYDSYMSRIMIAKIDKDEELGREKGSRFAEKYYRIDEIFYVQKYNEEGISSEKLEEILNKEIWSMESIGYTSLQEPYIYKISEEEKNKLIEYVSERKNERLNRVENLISTWEKVLPKEREKLLREIIIELEHLEINKEEMYDKFSKEIDLHVEKLTKLAKETGKDQLYFQDIVRCNKKEEECNWDIVSRFINEKGKEVIIRNHSY